MSSLSKLLNPNMRSPLCIPTDALPVRLCSTRAFHIYSGYYPRSFTTPHFYMWIGLTPEMWTQGYEGKELASVSFEEIYRDPTPIERRLVLQNANEYRRISIA